MVLLRPAAARRLNAALAPGEHRRGGALHQAPHRAVQRHEGRSWRNFLIFFRASRPMQVGRCQWRGIYRARVVRIRSPRRGGHPPGGQRQQPVLRPVPTPALDNAKRRVQPTRSGRDVEAKVACAMPHLTPCDQRACGSGSVVCTSTSTSSSMIGSNERRRATSIGATR